MSSAAVDSTEAPRIRPFVRRTRSLSREGREYCGSQCSNTANTALSKAT